MNEARFLKDVDQHVMEVLRDDGLYRHIRFRKPGTTCMHFDLMTWPGYLCYTGDMGTYVFSRLEDMFEFFRTDREYAQSRGRRLAINLSYWSEKLRATDGGRRAEGAEEFCQDKFARIIKETLVQWWRDGGLSAEQRHDLRQQVQEEILDMADDLADRCYQRAHDFRMKIGDKHYQFVDLWDHDFTDYTHRFKWCCYALAWGIEQYDNATVPAEAAA